MNTFLRIVWHNTFICPSTRVSKMPFAVPDSLSFQKHETQGHEIRRIIILKCITPVVFYANKEGVGMPNTTDFCILFIMLTTTCFGRCGPSSSHKIVSQGKLYRLQVLVVVHIHSFQWDLFVYRFIHILQKSSIEPVRTFTGRPHP
jgi:hypothetical protein